MDRMRYETFVRGAFSIQLNTLIDRWGDPAQLANTDEFNDSSINNVKAATSYSMAIYNTYIINNNEELTEDEYNRMHSIIEEVINAKDLNNINDLICEYTDDFRNKYVKFKWQK